MSYKSPSVSMPVPGRYCVVVTVDGQVKLAVWRREMGYPGAGGGFATFTRGKRTTRLDHIDGVLMWEEVRMPSPEEFSNAIQADRQVSNSPTNTETVK